MVSKFVALGLLGGVMAQTTPGASMMSSSSLKLAKSYEGDNFFSGFGKLAYHFHDHVLVTTLNISRFRECR